MKKLTLILVVMLILPIMPVSQASGDDGLKIKEVYYNTGPECEFLTLENWGGERNFEDVTLTNGKEEIQLPDFRLDDTEKLVISEDDEKYEEIWGEKPDLTWDGGSSEIDGEFSLPDERGKLILKRNGDSIDSFYYGEVDEKKSWEGESTEKLPEGTYARRRSQDTDSKEDWEWEREWNVGHSDFEPKEIDYEGEAVAFTSPDSSFNSIMSFLNNVNSSLWISIYKMTDLRIADKIAALSERGVNVKVLAEGSPVNGISKKAEHSLHLIEKSGGEVRLSGKDGYSPYNYLHSKYMVRDNESLFLASENLVRSSFSSSKSFGNRGWGTILSSKDLANYYRRVFKNDWGFGREFQGEEEIDKKPEYDEGNYFAKFDRKQITGTFEVTPVLSPDTSTSESTILDMIKGAEDSIYVQQYYIRHWENGKNPYLKAVKEVAERGVEVKVLLDSSHYNVKGEEEGNDELRDELNEFARKNDLKMEARLLSQYKGLMKTHTKGMIVDERKVLISSINWNANSMLQNREAGVIIESEQVGDYFSDVFLDDWHDYIEPIADAGENRTVQTSKEVLLTAENSWDDHRIVEYRWDIDDDGDFEKNGKKVRTDFSEEAEHEITLVVEDVEGNKDKDTFKMKVKKENDGIEFSKLASWFILGLPAIVITLFLVHTTLINRS